MEVPAIATSDTFRFRARRRTRWSDEDNQRVVNNAVYLTLIEEARLDYFGDLGLLEENQFPFVLMQTNVRFLAPAEGGQEVEVELRTTGMGRTSIRQAARVRRVEDGRTLVEAEVLLVGWDNAARAKAPLSPELRARVAEFEGLQPEAAGE